MNKKPIDQAIRDEATKQPYSFIIEAPAGSGKTELIANRILYRLLEVKNPKEIIAITFTIKAANNMKQRVINLYSKKLEINKKIKERAKRRKWDEHFIFSLQIMTIDSLASNITKQTPLLSNAGVINKVDIDPKEIYESVVKKVIIENPDKVEIIYPYLQYDYQKLTKQLIELLNKRDQWLDNIYRYKDMTQDDVKKETTKYYQQELKQWLGKIKALFSTSEIEEIKDIINYSNTNLSIKEFTYSEDDINFWLHFRDLILTNDLQIIKRFTIKQGFPPGPSGKKYKENIKKILEKNNNNINILENFSNVIYEKNIHDIFAIMPSLCSLLIKINVELVRTFNDRNTIDFIGILSSAIVALKNTDIPVVLDESISHILIDEFQDTNKAQLEFIKLLTQNFSGNPHKSFFAVGDPMQSIYRFRKAEVEIFQQSQESGIGDLKLKPLTLKTNFRSNQPIIDWINKQFSSVFPSKDHKEEGAVSYRLCISHETEEKYGGGINSHILKINTKSAYAENQAEARYVYEQIKKIQKNDPDLEIAVLVRSRAHLSELLTLIKREDSKLPIEAIEIDPLESNQSYQDILILSKALYNFDDKVSWIGILRGPWCGLTLNDLTILFENNTDLTAWEIINNLTITNDLSPGGQKRLEFIRNVISNNNQYRGRVSHRYFIEVIWRQLSCDKLLLEPDDLKQIDTFLDLIDESSSPLSIDFEKLVRLADNLHTTEIRSGERKAIKFYTIHKAKGEEFDCVIIPGLNRETKAEEHQLILSDKNILSINNNDQNKNLYNYHRSKELAKLKHEQIRLLYVAITRAKVDCHLIGAMKRDKETPNKNTFLDILWPILEHKFIPIEAATNSQNYEEFPPKLRRLKFKMFNNPPKIETQIKGNLKEYPKIRIENIYTFTGELIHKYLELIVKKQLDVNHIKNNKIDFIRQILKNKNFTDEEINQSIKVINDTFENLLNSKDGMWIKQLHDEDQIETKYLLNEYEEINTFIPDRTFITDKVRWIIDYKTVFEKKDLKKEAIKHKEQLQNYERLFDTQYPTQKAIYFLAQGKLVLI
ncbi:MAG: UvrD-helicase domain-containing protein [Methylophilaceae bacterium]